MSYFMRGGYQFGRFAGQLGDGAAMYVGLFRIFTFPSVFNCAEYSTIKIIQLATTQYQTHTSTPELMIGSEVVERVNRFTYLGGLIRSCGLVFDEISTRIQEACPAFANSRHLWRKRDIRLTTKRTGLLCTSSFRPTLWQ
ncbi:unnamed protein product [Schistosoma margrebowiei]|uniref:Uncharacterized protein n=1 Tax=Schistosoma margrebowiei TaxID=48269 RepID=A0A183LWH2_9TREM|nr:unnamed protein product [Schistosoma margrebowiei]